MATRTVAPAALVEARRDLLQVLDMHPGQTVSADLDPAEVGIVGDDHHDGGYHCGAAGVVRNAHGTITDYSVTESSRDRAGLDEHASALDIGWWAQTVGGKAHNLRTMSIWLVAQATAGAEHTGDIREIIYSPDGKTVKRWDRLGVRSGGDAGHLTHTHVSLFRDASGASVRALLRRYMTSIGLLEDDMPTAKDLLAADVDPSANEYTLGGAIWTTMQRTSSLIAQLSALTAEQRQATADDSARDQLTLAAIQAITTAGGPEAAPIVAAINAARDQLAATVNSDNAQLHAALTAAEAQLHALREQLAAAGTALATPPPG